MKEYLTTAQAAERLGVTASRVRQLILEGRVMAEKIGRDNFVPVAEIERFEKADRPTGIHKTREK